MKKVFALVLSILVGFIGGVRYLGSYEYDETTKQIMIEFCGRFDCYGMEDGAE